jgi:hypothetical protein
VFYFGNAIGDSGLGNTAIRAYVDGTDLAGARDNPHQFVNRALVDDAFDFNRDSFVDGTDMAIVRDNTTNLATALRLFAVPSGSGAKPTLAALTSPGLPSNGLPPVGRESPAASGAKSSALLGTAAMAPGQPQDTNRPLAGTATAGQIANDALLTDSRLRSSLAAKRVRVAAEASAAIANDLLSLLADAAAKVTRGYR